MSEFVYLFRNDDPPTAPELMQQYMQKWLAWMKDLTAKGHFKGGNPLERTGAKVVAGPQKAVTDGPFAEAKDLIGGYMLVDARDLTEATELSRGCPILDRGGVVEVRTVRKMNL
jgi:hypothetical protein